MKRKIRNLIFILLTLILVFCEIFFVSVKTRISNLDTVAKNVTSEEFAGLEFINCSRGIQADGTVYYFPDNEDPQVYLPVPAEAINCIKINYLSDSMEPSDIRVYYAAGGDILTEERSCVATFGNENNECIVLIPHQVYSILRLDINGNYSIESIQLGNISEPIFQHNVVMDRTCLMIFIAAVAFLIVFDFLTRNWA